MLYTEEQIELLYESHTDPDKKIYILCHMFVESMFIHKNKDEITLKGYFESLIFTCHYVMCKFAGSNVEHKNNLYKCFMFCLAVELKKNNLFETEQEALFFVIKRHQTIDLEFTFENLEEKKLLSLILNNVFYEPFNNDGDDEEYVMGKIGFGEMMKLQMELISCVKALSNGIDEIAKIL
jgi:hypothetical protein